MTYTHSALLLTLARRNTFCFQATDAGNTAGVVSEAGSCCALNSTAGANVTLDRAGQRCSQGLDACGVCGGDGLTVDFTGVCCNGAIDASGLCCAAPHLVDDFGVCGGNSSTGVIVLDLDVLSSTVSGNWLAWQNYLANKFLLDHSCAYELSTH